MILRVSLLFFIMASALTGMFTSNSKVNDVISKPGGENAAPELKGWPESSQYVAKEMMAKYGMPGEYTESMLIWKNNTPWKKTILYKEQTEHSFPITHPDQLEQTILYKVPEEKFNELAKFDGSVTANRTNGTLTVRCLNEKLNILTVNLAMEIIQGKKTAEQARLAYYKSATEIIKGGSPEYSHRLFYENTDK